MGIKKIAATMVASVLLVVGCGQNTAQAAEGDIMFIGDSMTSLYNDTPGSTAQGWWSMVARAKGLNPIKEAEYGSGHLRYGFGTYNNSGTACTGTILKDRLQKIRDADPEYIIVAAGRNDLKKCVNGTPVAASMTESVQAAKNYFAALRDLAAEEGIPLSKIYVMVPWANSEVEASTVYRPKIRDWSRSYGFTWITTWVLSASETRSDNLHQNYAGNQALRDDVLAGVNF